MQRGICALGGSEKACGSGKERPFRCNEHIKGSPDNDRLKDLPTKSSRKKKPRLDLPRNFDSTTAASKHGTNQTQSLILSECPFEMKYEKRGPSTGWTVKFQMDSKWEDLPVRSSYTQSLDGTHTMTIKPGVYVLVNYSSVEYGEKLTLEDEKKLWVAHVREVRSLLGSEPTPTFLLICWMYRPHELPEGAEDYHGKQELVASKWQAIINVETVSNTLDVTFWYEYSTVPKGWYWRQTYHYPESNNLSVSESNLANFTIANISRLCANTAFVKDLKTLTACSLNAITVESGYTMTVLSMRCIPVSIYSTRTLASESCLLSS